MLEYTYLLVAGRCLGTHPCSKRYDTWRSAAESLHNNIERHI